MSAAVQILEPEADVRAAMRAIGAERAPAARVLANAPAEQKNRALTAAARVLSERSRRYSCRQRAGSGRRPGQGPDAAPCSTALR